MHGRVWGGRLLCSVQSPGRPHGEADEQKCGQGEGPSPQRTQPRVPAGGGEKGQERGRTGGPRQELSGVTGLQITHAAPPRPVGGLCLLFRAQRGVFSEF